MKVFENRGMELGMLIFSGNPQSVGFYFVLYSFFFCFFLFFFLDSNKSFLISEIYDILVEESKRKVLKNEKYQLKKVFFFFFFVIYFFLFRK
jgi:hypothetical protein